MGRQISKNRKAPGLRHVFGYEFITSEWPILILILNSPHLP